MKNLLLYLNCEYMYLIRCFGVKYRAVYFYELCCILQTTRTNNEYND